ncbi:MULTISPECIES: trans-aconitate 2-methyltransferase [Streptacidiphilus]|uniref:Trans-aconitate 2-methyltransferase n=1 Tax=Streptacidiphilus cavernicola TaxID=3342716 RepID=A0ABV6UFS1_9ACTN|nr:class I SAM-dependent methyltransferase [Streptacidiphilus jeojiense]
MNRQRISAIAHQYHSIAAPLDSDSADLLLRWGLPVGDERVLDLGCGRGAWLELALDGRPELQVVGVDLDPAAFENVPEVLTGKNVELRVGDAAEYSSEEPFHLVLCMGATHAFGGLLPTLEAARRHLAPGGSVLVGDGYWEREPGPAALEIFGDGSGADPFSDLAGTVDRVVRAGWTPVFAHTSTTAELDEYEWSWTGTLSEWALDHPDDPDSAAALEAARVHREEWLRDYRRTFGFVSLVLRRTDGGA